MPDRVRIEAARGNTVPGGRISSLGATGSGPMPHARADAGVKSDGRPSWVGRNKYAR